MEIKCKCGAINDYRTEMKGEQKTAWCNKCNCWIKNIPYKEPQIYFGKYKGTKIADMKTDEQLNYLRWMIDNVKITNNFREIIIKHLSK